MSSVPGGTLTGTPSMVRFTTPSAISAPPSRDHYGLPLARDVVLEFAAKLLDAGDDGRGAGVGEHADRLPGHVVREVEQEIEIGRLPRPARIRSRILVVQAVPSRHWVHWAHDSWA